MTKPFLPTRSLLLVLFLSLTLLSGCKGGTCGPLTSPLADADSDCVEDGADNCVFIYNPTQFDGDEDGVGFACDDDDTDDSVALKVPTVFVPGYPSAGESLPALAKTTDDCRYFLVGCDDHFLGYLDKEIAKDKEQDFFNKWSFYARDSTSCSAFNPAAKYPPALFCEEGEAPDKFIGYLTVNTEFAHAIPSCEFLKDLGINHENCR